MPIRQCQICGKSTKRIQPLINIPICQNCGSKNEIKEKYEYIPKSWVRRNFRLNDADLADIIFFEKPNPHYQSGPKMKLFLLKEIERLSKNKWGSKEPYSVKLINNSQEFINWLIQDMNRIKTITPRDFEFLIAERLDKMNYNVQLVGDTYEKDGGIDIIATPKNSPFPYILAVQAKHHKTERKTAVREVRDFFGSISGRNSIFNLGFIVTNTEFTTDANFFAQNNSTLLRLRDNKDLTRWLQEDFDNEFNWKEMPNSLILPNKKEILIPRDRIIH